MVLISDLLCKSYDFFQDKKIQCGKITLKRGGVNRYKMYLNNETIYYKIAKDLQRIQPKNKIQKLIIQNIVPILAKSLLKQWF